MKRSARFFGILISFIIVTFAFQNCGPGFKVSDGSVDLSSNGASASLGVQFVDFTTCRTNTAGGTSAALATCLNNNSQNAGFTAAAIDTCVAAGANTDLALAVCLSKSGGPVVLNHRPPKQYDIDACNSAVGLSNISTCLNRRGVLSGISQLQITNCVSAAGLSGVEKCLRNNNAIPRKGTLMQSDINLCLNVTGANSQIAACLANAELVPASLVQADIDACVTAVGIGSVARCLRSNYKVSRVLMQSQVAECAALVGNASIATCLDNNGLNVNPVLVADLQVTVNNCITANAGSISTLARCLRTNNAVPMQVTQGAISLCADLVGASGIYACLASNFPAVQIPTALNQAAIDTCVNTVGVGVPLAKRCLTFVRKIFNDMPAQEDINTCAIYAGNTPVATNPLQVGIGACLETQGLSLGTLTQAQIDACIADVGLVGVQNCLYNRGHIGSYQRLLSGTPPQDVLNRCTACHTPVGGAGGMNIADHAQITLRLVPGVPANSALYNRILRNVAGFNPMPPDGAAALPLNAEETERVRVWIVQGARNN